MIEDCLNVSLYSGGRWRRLAHLVCRPPYWWVGWRLIMQVLGSDLWGCIMGLAKASLVGRLEVDQSTLQVLRSAFENLYHGLSKCSLGDMLGECIEEISSGRYVRTLVNAPSLYDWSRWSPHGWLLRQTFHSYLRTTSLLWSQLRVPRPCSKLGNCIWVDNVECESSKCW